MSRYTRRDLLRSAGLGLGAAYASGLGLGDPYRRAAMAAPISLAPSAAGAIFFVLNGGARTQAVFNGTVGRSTNPFGTLSGLPVPLSSLMQNTGLERPEVNRWVNLVSACQHHNRTGSHADGRAVACTGYTLDDEKAGILTVINHAFAFRPIPCVNIGSDSPVTNIGSEVSSTFAPLKISSYADVRTLTESLAAAETPPAEVVRLDRLRAAISDRFFRRTKYPEPAQIPYFQRDAAGVADRLRDPVLDLTSNAALGALTDGNPVSNDVLRPAFGVNNAGGGNLDGANALLALRLRQLGVAGVSISTSQNWDLHQNEIDALPGRARALGQAIAGLVESMARIVDPIAPGKTLLDTTVITVLTDFNRGNWSLDSGFNATNGSDHRTEEDKTSFQCIPLIGGGMPGGKVLGQILGNGSPARGSPTYGTRQILATVLDLMGLPANGYFPGAPPLTGPLSG